MDNIEDLQFKTLTEILVHNGAFSDRVICFIAGKDKEIRCSFNDVYEKSLEVLGFLQQKGLKNNDKLVFQLNDNYDFIHTFWACILGGIIAVPVICDEKKEFKSKVFNIINTLENCYIICSQERLNELSAFGSETNYQVSNLSSWFIDKAEAFSSTDAGVIYKAKQDDVAFIQFSSGSTDNPKGVVVSQKNLAANVFAIVEGANLSEVDTHVSWLPLTHDMGLIGCHLAMLAGKVNQYIMPTSLFIRKPSLWLDKITEHKATVLISPDFGLQYALLSLKEQVQYNYDLSSIRVLLNGAEPISVKVCREFSERMGQYGFKDTAMVPVYGMAEATLAIAFPKLIDPFHVVIVDRNKLAIGQKVEYLNDADSVAASPYVDEGYAVSFIQFRICDDEDQIVEEDFLGNIQIQGECVARGYYNNDQATKESWSKDGWFKTGDIGFIHNGRLVVIGRTKEVIIVNGQNYIANDLERIISEVPGVTAGKVAVSSVYDRETQKEKIAVFIIYRSKTGNFSDMTHAIKLKIFESIGIFIDYVIPVTNIPKTSSGKLMRFALKRRFETGAYDELLKDSVESKSLEQHDVELAKKKEQDEIKDIADRLLELCHDIFPNLDVKIESNFLENGVNSLLITKLCTKIDESYPSSVAIEDFFSYTTIKDIAQQIYINKTLNGSKQNGEIRKEAYQTNDKIAIIGMSAILPGASNIDAFWDNLCNSIESVGSIPADRKKDINCFYSNIGKSADDNFIQGGYLSEIDKFDHSFFGIINREATAMSPAQRMFLETAYLSMEDAGYGGDSMKSTRTGVYVGYIADLETQQYQKILKASNDNQTPTGALSSNIPGRLSYFMDFKGPSIIVDSACSASLSALHAACQGIMHGDCDQAVVGSVQFNLFPTQEQNIGIESKSGHVRAFDEEADGTCEGEGVVALVIKPYSKAVQDKDHIYALITSIATNQDGRSVGLSAPNPKAQYELIEMALKKAGLTKDDISYIEAHGTGTKLGDPIELNVLAKLFATEYSDLMNRSCGVGSVKSNIGHLYASSGLVSVVKCCMMLKHKKIPATINFNKLNQKINLQNSLLYINDRLRDWDYTNNKPRRCGISNFGFSGTNCHVILEEPSDDCLYENRLDNDIEYPFVLSAPTKAGLDNLVKKYLNFLSVHKESNIADICYTAAVGRGDYQYRFATIVNSIEVLTNKLQTYHGTADFLKNIFIGNVVVLKETKDAINWNEITLEEQERSKLAMNVICKDIAGEKRDNRLAKLVKLCQLYVNGAGSNWLEVFNIETVQKISIPGYKFNKKRFWPT